MIVTKTYASKSNTICTSDYNKGMEDINLGLNPILEISHGKGLTSRGLIYFDHGKVKSLVEDKVYPDMGKLKHVLHLANTGSLVEKDLNDGCSNSAGNAMKVRASSFDLIVFLIPNEWDCGRGFDYVIDLHNDKHSANMGNGSSWNKCMDYFRWVTEENGVYTTDTLASEYELYTSVKGNKSKVIVAHQHFDYGTESLEIDITETFNRFVSGELDNYGFGIAFAPQYESEHGDIDSYIGFFSPHTHSFYEPYIETTYDEYINDDRADFYAEKENKLYFYSMVNGEYVNLDEMPTCHIDGTEYTVHQATKGVYYINVSVGEELADTMLYDTWSIMYKGKRMKDIELSVVVKPQDGYFSFGLPSESKHSQIMEVVPSLYGIQYKEEIKRGDIRKVNVDCRLPYTSNQNMVIDGKLDYRVYVEEGLCNHLDVIDWTPVERGYNENFFQINTNDLIPHRYFVDVRITNNGEITHHRKLLQFDIVSDMTNKVL